MGYPIRMCNGATHLSAEAIFILLSLLIASVYRADGKKPALGGQASLGER
jgi:hypothetical protein